MYDSNSSSAGRATWWQAALLIRGMTATDQRNIRVFSTWSFVTALGFAAVILAHSYVPQLDGTLAWMLAMIPVVLSVATLRVFLRLLREADEFMRKVQLEGIAVGFGAGTIFCVGYFTLELFGAPEVPMIVATLPMMFGWAVGAFLVASRHR